MGLILGSLMSREVDRLGVFENRVLVGVFGLNRGRVRGGSRKQYNDDLSNLYSSPSINKMNTSWRLSWEEAVACLGRR
jgi:hypothetical protein